MGSRELYMTYGICHLRGYPETSREDCMAYII